MTAAPGLGRVTPGPPASSGRRHQKNDRPRATPARWAETRSSPTERCWRQTAEIDRLREQLVARDE
ncbi:MAG: hypothetical protein AAB249_06050, partial [Acidobacteriota bacterium]